jgi:[protein-PII] uridylyltransferase
MRWVCCLGMAEHEARHQVGGSSDGRAGSGGSGKTHVVWFGGVGWMEINLAKIGHHIDYKLRLAEGGENREERLGAIRRFVGIENNRLHLRHRHGIDGPQIVGARSLIVDRLIQHLAATVVRENPEVGENGTLAIVALGGYGRRELSPLSDIDILFLYPDKGSLGAMKRLNEALLYLLWDTGFTVGHSVRSLAECLVMAQEDRVSRHSLIDARLVWGSEGMLQTLEKRLDREVFEKNPLGGLTELMEDRAARYRAHGAVVCLQEPNLKETAGGLRDLQTLGWAGRIGEGVHGLNGLVEAGLITEGDRREMREAYDFMLRVRNDLHFLTGRHTDVLTLALQQQVAPHFGFEDRPEMQASELFMRDYYLRARRLHSLATSHLEALVGRHEKRRWFKRQRVEPAVGGFVMRDGVLELDERSVGFDGARAMLAFGYAQATGSGLSPSLQGSIRALLESRTERLGDDSGPAVGGTVQSLLRIIGATGKVAQGLRLMHNLDFLGRILPEFGRVTCLVQHDLYHRYTVDEHTLRALEVLDELAESRGKATERYRELYRSVTDPLVLHLGLLFHDIGKGLGGGHTEKGVRITEAVCARWQLEPERAETVVFLVRQHLTMSHISQRRDLSDEKVIRDFAALVGTIERLDLLTLLTYADINAVGPGVWSEWKDALLWELYQRTKDLLAPGEETARARESLIRLLAKSLVSEMDEAEVRRHFELLPADYGRYTAPATIIEHLRLINRRNPQMVQTNWKVDLPTRCTDLHLSAPNRRGLLAAVTGALTAQGVNILSLHLNTRADGVAIDSFKVRDTAGEPIIDSARWQQIDFAITRALNGEFDVEAAVARRLHSQHSSRFRKRRMRVATPVSFNWDQESSEKSTILEVQVGDRLGLAYRISNTLAGRGLDIVFAKVATEKHLALDIFYVVNEAGEKLPDESLPLIEQALQEALRDHGVESV